MINPRQLKPFKNFGPGIFIQEQMGCREWTQTDLAEVLGTSVKTVNLLLKNKQSVTLEMARLLGEAFGQSAQFWMNLETNYRLRLEESTEKQQAVKKKSPIYEFMPITEMVRKGWLKSTKNVAELESQIHKFWHKSAIDFSFMKENQLQISCKKSDAYTQFSDYALQCWFQMAENCTKEIRVPNYDKKKLEILYTQMNEYTIKKNGISEFLDELNACGVKFLVLSHLQKTYLDGAAFLYEANPAIVYTARCKRIDNFWFTLAHEIAHILLHIETSEDYYLDCITEKEESQKEQEADVLAQEKLKHQEILTFFKEKVQYITLIDLEKCSKLYRISQNIILGTLAYEKAIPYTNPHLHRLNTNPLEEIPKEYLFENHIKNVEE